MIIDPYTWHRLSIDTLTPVSVDTIAVGMKRPADYTFRAGQYAVVRITKKTGQQFIRQYSFSSAPDQEILELLIQREPGGEVSNWFFDSTVLGAEIELSQPFGSFTLETAQPRPVLFIAGRVGITPFISMLRDKKHRKVSIIYSVRSQDQVCFPELLESHDTTTIYTAASPRVSREFLHAHLQTQPLIYICGSKQFVDSVTTLLMELDVPASDIKRELFTLQ